MLSNEDRQRIKDHFDVYDLIEELDVSVDELIDAFDYKIEETQSIMEKIGYADFEEEA